MLARKQPRWRALRSQIVWNSQKSQNISFYPRKEAKAVINGFPTLLSDLEGSLLLHQWVLVLGPSPHSILGSLIAPCRRSAVLFQHNNSSRPRGIPSSRAVFLPPFVNSPRLNASSLLWRSVPSSSASLIVLRKLNKKGGMRDACFEPQRSAGSPSYLWAAMKPISSRLSATSGSTAVNFRWKFIHSMKISAVKFPLHIPRDHYPPCPFTHTRCGVFIRAEELLQLLLLGEKNPAGQKRRLVFSCTGPASLSRLLQVWGKTFE